MDVETKPSKLVYFNPFSDGEMRLYLPEGDHVFRAAFLNDDFVKTITTDKDAYNDKKNKFIGSITFVGPYPVQSREDQPQEDPDLRSRRPARPASRRSLPTWRTTPIAGR